MSELPDTWIESGQYRLGENVFPSNRYGLIRRTPFTDDYFIGGDHFAQIGIFKFDETLYAIKFNSNGDINAFNLQTQTSFNISNSLASRNYLQTAKPTRESIFFVQIFNDIFVINREVPVEPKFDFILKPQVATVYVKTGLFSSRYVIYIDGQEVANLKTQDPLVGGSTLMATDFIAYALTKGLTAALAIWPYGGANVQDKYLEQDLPVGIQVRVESNVIVITKGSIVNQPPVITIEPISVSTEDSYGDRAIISFVDQVQTFSELPPKYFNNMIVKITGNTSEAGGYVRFETEDTITVFGAGTWIECAGWHPKWNSVAYPNQQVSLNAFDERTMPVNIHYQNGIFNCDVVKWEKRNAGDCTTNPMPSFMSPHDAYYDEGICNPDTKNPLTQFRYIRNDFIYHDRLGFLSGANACLSVTGEYANFFADSAFAIIDSDPVDTSIPSYDAHTVLNHAVVFKENLLLFTNDKCYDYQPRESNISPKNSRFDVANSIGNHEWIIPAVHNEILVTVKDEDIYVFIDNISKAIKANTVIPSWIVGINSVAVSSDLVLVGCDRNDIWSLHFSLNQDSPATYAWNRIRSNIFNITINKVFILNKIIYVSHDSRIALNRFDRDLLSQYIDVGNTSYVSFVFLSRQILSYKGGTKLEHRNQILRGILEVKQGVVSLSTESKKDNEIGVFRTDADQSHSFINSPLIGIDATYDQTNFLKFPVMKDARKLELTIRSVDEHPFVIGQLTFEIKINSDCRII